MRYYLISPNPIEYHSVLPQFLSFNICISLAGDTLVWTHWVKDRGAQKYLSIHLLYPTTYSKGFQKYNNNITNHTPNKFKISMQLNFVLRIYSTKNSQSTEFKGA